MREVLKQSEYAPLSVAEQIASFLTVTAGIFDPIEIDQVDEAETSIRKALLQQLPDVCHRIETGEQLSDDDKEAILKMARERLRHSKRYDHSMASIELLKRRIRTAGDLRSLVRTMKALAAVSIRQYEKAVESLVEYNRTVEMGFQILLREREMSLFKGWETKKCLGAVVFGSDLGMCGQFNEQIAAYALESMKKLGCEPVDTSCIVVGARVTGYLEDGGY